MLVPLVPLVLLAGCDGDGGDEFEAEVVVESYQIAGEPLKQVRLSRTDALDATYDFTALALSDADVRVALLDAGGAVEEVYPYRELEAEPGVYVPEAAAIVRPLRSYRLEVEAPGVPFVRSTTVVPDTFRVVGVNADALPYQGGEQFELRVTRSEYPGRQSYYVFKIEALDASEETLVPFAAALVEEADIALEDLADGSSPILNEGNYDIEPGGTVVIRLPWLAVAFYGPTLLSALALDDNLYDFIRSVSVQQGGSTFSPGEIPDVLDRVEGGRGVFGSYARVRYLVEITRGQAGGGAEE